MLTILFGRQANKKLCNRSKQLVGHSVLINTTLQTVRSNNRISKLTQLSVQEIHSVALTNT